MATLTRMSSSHFQMIIYFNIVASLVWFALELSMFVWRNLRFEGEIVFTYVSPILLFVFFSSSIWRVTIGSSGNMNERIPELAGFLLLTILPQFIVCVYFGWLQEFPFPVEIIVNSIHIALLLIEFTIGYVVTSSIVKDQSRAFAMHQFQKKTSSIDRAPNDTKNIY